MQLAYANGTNIGVMSSSVAAIVVSFLLLSACDSESSSAQQSSNVTDVEVEAAHQLLSGDSPPIVLDVRTPEEFSASHIAGARNINVLADDFAQGIGELDRSQPYLVHCAAGAAGGRSKQAVEQMRAMGFENVYHLEGGFNAWGAVGKPTE